MMSQKIRGVAKAVDRNLQLSIRLNARAKRGRCSQVDAERQRIQERLAAAGLLDAPDEAVRVRRPSRRRFEAARAAAGRGTALSEIRH